MKINWKYAMLHFRKKNHCRDISLYNKHLNINQAI